MSVRRGGRGGGRTQKRTAYFSTSLQHPAKGPPLARRRMFIYADGIYGTMEFLDGGFPESRRAKETSCCFNPFIVAATFSTRTSRCLGFREMANLMEMNSNVYFVILFFFFYDGFILHNFTISSNFFLRFTQVSFI